MAQAETRVDPMVVILDRLTQTVEQLTLQGRQQRVRLTTPSFDGQGDVELFIQQFMDVADASDWEAEICLL